ncbi:UNC93-like protein MFSD11 [Diabrotica virgifera virgifera]|uniref:UNC93-like protein MFSD11 n=1 Tax=Diabrotica virgifera virgifera TaxID=50390 RepID=A0A6P7GXC5_DIAVI|nr:UNC93-like protein MFSD11 [Diabrotica virgifera virgifera]
MSNIQKIIVDSIKKDKSSYKESGYYSQAINNAAYAVFAWAVPSVINACGLKLSMCLGVLINILFIFQFLLEEVWILYTFCGLAGMGCAILWIGEGDYLAQNSSDKTINRNTAIFSTIVNSSMIVGNIIVLCSFSGKEKINRNTRILLLTILAGACAVGLVIMLFLPKHKPKEKDSKDSGVIGPVDSILNALKLFCTRNMLLLSCLFLYGGLEYAFFNGIYSSAIGFTKVLDNRKQLVGMSGVFVGIGEIFAGGVISIFGKQVADLGRRVLVVVAFFIHSMSFILIFINLPNDSPFGDTDQAAIIESSSVLAMFCSFLLGLGDCIYVNVIVSLLGTVYSENTFSGFAIYQFFIGVGIVISFISATFIGLYYQLLILFVLCVVSAACLLIVDASCKQKVLK